MSGIDETTSRVDPRVLRTKERLFEALLELVAERRWEKIRVQDVLDRTGVSRSAFYAHYDNKFDLLTAAIPELTITLTNADGDGFDLVPLFEHVEDVADTLGSLMSQPILGEIAAAMHRHLVTAWSAHLDTVDGNDDWLLPEMLAGATYAVLRTYLAQRDREPPAVVAARFSRHLDGLLLSRSRS